MKITIRKELLAAFGLLLVFIMVVGLVGIWQTTLISQRSEQMYRDDFAGAQEARQFVLDLDKVHVEVLSYLLAGDADLKSKIEDRFTSLDQTIEGHITAFRSGDANGSEQAAIDDIAQAWAAYKETRDTSVMRLSQASQAAQAAQAATGELHTRFEAVTAAIDRLGRSKAESASNANAFNRSVTTQNRWIIGGIALLAILVGAAVAQLIANEMRDTLQKYVAFASKVAQGDLTVQLSTQRLDEFSTLANHLNQMVRNLRELSSEVRKGVQNMGASTTDILAVVSQHTASANEQAAAVNQVSATIEEVHTAAEQSAQKASEVVVLAQTSVHVSKDGAKAIESIHRGIEEIRITVESIAHDILALSQQTQQIGEIITAVSEIADQSNILALNAAIEAAKAGEQGKGFAVVAGEVRNLANQSKQATTRVRTILGDIQKAANAAVLATEQGTAKTRTGMELADCAGDIIGQLGETIHTAEQSMQQIAASAHQQRTALDQIAQAMRDINLATAQFATGASQSQAAAETLNSLAGDLRTLTDNYQL